MEYENPTGSDKKTQCLNSDIISTLPQNMIENILSLMPLRDAVRTSILSKKWRYSWRRMPKLAFTDDMVKLPSINPLKKLKLVSAIFHVLMFHNGPRIVDFKCPVGELAMVSELDQIISYLSWGNDVKELALVIDDDSTYKLPLSFFSLQGFKHIELQNCTFELPVVYYGFSRLTTMIFGNVNVSAQKLQQFLSMCPLIECLCLKGCQHGIDFVTEGNKFTFVDLLRCVPSVWALGISIYYMKYLSAGGMPHKLPTSLVNLTYLILEVCLTEQNQISSTLCIISSSPMLSKVNFRIHYDNEYQQTPANFLDPEAYADMKLDHLETLEIANFGNLPHEIAFVKLIMAKTPVLQNVLIELDDSVSADEELRMLRDMVRLPFLRASPSAKVIFKRP
ncbi:F-box/FBD/LRR-repeat protein At1g13570-like [Bidens hawaiensis]|uniref:F-box/FBD/LRR-repeat protein At1g13570-like n=1 Tax=Bidens hawaiensis TaxID=980011 RepID=UPI004048FA23